MLSDFYTVREKEIAAFFLKNRYIIVPAEDIDLLNGIRHKVAHAAAKAIQHSIKNDADIDYFLNNIHHMITVNELNDIRLKVIGEINQDPDFRKSYYHVGREILGSLVGNEMAMQRRINLSIQLPNDDSSLLPVHADVWAGDSPYEIVQWVPLVDCYATKSMYIADAIEDEKIQAAFQQFQGKSSEYLFKTIENHVKFLEVPFGSILLFTQNVMHGNRVNLESETRWSMNCRFKNLLTPYHGKEFGEFFEPITLRPATRLGLEYRLPEGFHEE
jgi:sporadic carbohydrate cluster 2OG-Fe(II) oxygenase